MKKIIILSLCALFFISGCKSNESNNDEAKYNLYEEYRNQLISNNGTPSYNIPFTYQMEVTSLDEGMYSYTVIVDEPQIVMNQVKIMALNIDEDTTSDMIANAGILDDNTYSLVPNQVDVEKGYPKGIAINGKAKTKDFTIYVIVSFYKDSQASTQTTVFFTFYVENGEVVSEVDDE